jgi:hypothetical protein
LSISSSSIVLSWRGSTGKDQPTLPEEWYLHCGVSNGRVDLPFLKHYVFIKGNLEEG